MMYEGLVGYLPFEGEQPQQILLARVTQQPRPLPAGPGIPPALREVVMRCLESGPAARFRSAAMMRQALQAAPWGGLPGEHDGLAHTAAVPTASSVSGPAPVAPFPSGAQPVDSFAHTATAVPAPGTGPVAAIDGFAHTAAGADPWGSTCDDVSANLPPLTTLSAAVGEVGASPSGVSPRPVPSRWRAAVVGAVALVALMVALVLSSGSEGPARPAATSGAAVEAP